MRPNQKVITMKIDTVDAFQHINAVLILVFCVLYSSLYYGTYRPGLIAWVFGFMSIYGSTLSRNPDFPEEDTITKKKISPFLGWFLAAFYLGLLTESSSLQLASSIPFAILIVFAIYYLREYSRMYFNLALVIRGELKILKEIGEYIMNSSVSNKVTLIEPIFTQENLCIVKEQEWHTHEFKEKGLRARLEPPKNEHRTFACVLQGKIKHLEKIKMHIIDHYSLDGLIESFKTTYSKDKLYIVKESEWNK